MIRDEASFGAFLDAVRKFVRDKAIPREAEVEQTGEIPDDLVQTLRQGGFFGWSIPEAYGGAGLTTEELVLAAFELSQGAVAFRARVGTNTGIGSEGLVVDGTEEQKKRYLPRLASGEWTSCLAITEPEAGSEASNVRTMARRDGDSFILDGEKRYITNAPIADVFTITARTEPGTKGAKGVSAFIVERGTPGLVSSIIGGVEGAGFATVMKALNKQRIHLAALSTGPAMRMLELAVDHARTRVQFGQPVAQHQLVQALIADCQTEIFAARSMILETARKRDRGEDVVLEASMCKYFATEMCGRVADRCVQIFGGAGYVADYAPIERWFRDVRLFRLYEGTSQIHQLNIARLTLNRTPSP